MEVAWKEGQAWIRSSFYEGPHELLLVFAERARLSWQDLSLSELFAALVTLLPDLALEERMELLVFASHLIRLKALALLPVPLQAGQVESQTEGSVPPSFPFAELLRSWEPLIERQAYRWPRPTPTEALEKERFITGIPVFRLVRAYQEVLERMRRRQARAALAAPPFTLEEVEANLLGYFQQCPTWWLSELWQRLYPHPFYRAVALMVILGWIQEGRLLLQVEDLWSARLSWRS